MRDPIVRLMIVDDHEVVRVGLVSLLSTVGRFSVVGEAGSVAEAVAEARRCLPDVVLMDVRLPDGSGVEACREIRSDLPGTGVLILTSYSGDQALVAAVVAGASGCVLKDADPEDLLAAIATVAEGGSLIAPWVCRVVEGWMQGQGLMPSVHDPVRYLGPQERMLLPLIAAGKTNREIAFQLNIGECMVRSYVSGILRKLELPGFVDTDAALARL